MEFEFATVLHCVLFKQNAVFSSLSVYNTNLNMAVST